jgi:sialic acid synthase SpsE
MNQKPYLIAEIAQAHDGSLGILHSYIDAVAKTGVQAMNHFVYNSPEKMPRVTIIGNEWNSL